MKRKGSFVGTPEYASPEMLVPPTITTRASDIWAYGCIVFQFISGRPPFKEGTDYLTMKKIQEGKYEFPEGFDEVIKTLVRQCLVIDPVVRITGESLHIHPFFESVRWETLWKETPPTLESGIVSPPENHSQALSLSWSDIEGSEEEMEDLRREEDRNNPHPDTPTQLRSKNESPEPKSRHGRSTSAGTSTSLVSSLFPSDYQSKMRRFSQSSDTSRRRLSPFDGTAHGVIVGDSKLKGQVLSVADSRNRRMSPSSMDGRPAVSMLPQSHPLDEQDEGNVIEDDSDLGSGEGPPSTIEDHPDLMARLTGPIDGSGSLPLVATVSGHTKPSSTNSSVDMTLMSTSGTSGASAISAGANVGPSRSPKGFEMVRGVRGVELGKHSLDIVPKDVAWLLTNG
jgi:hypothetical protein